jgi:hypothetical protein
VDQDAGDVEDVELGDRETGDEGFIVKIEVRGYMDQLHWSCNS